MLRLERLEARDCPSSAVIDPYPSDPLGPAPAPAPAPGPTAPADPVPLGDPVGGPTLPPPGELP